MAKQGYSIGEVASMIGVETHTVRFWSNELQALFSPKIGAGGRRYYTQEDITRFKKVKELVHEKGYRLGFIRKNGLGGEIKPMKDFSSLAGIITNIERQIDNLMKQMQ